MIGGMNSGLNSEESSNPYVVAIGASGGEGLDDIRDLLSRLPSELPAIVLVVLHRPSNQISFLRDVLARGSKMPVRVATDRDRFRVGYCYMASLMHIFLSLPTAA
jgi:chemotaxis response regulator CheB